MFSSKKHNDLSKQIRLISKVLSRYLGNVIRNFVFFFIAGHDPLASSTATVTSGPGQQSNPAGEISSGGTVRGGTLDVLLSTTYCRSQMYLSRQLAQLHPELTMPMFSGKWFL